MPRLVDHEQRRREITGAMRRVIARGGLEAATFQSVAAEAGISVRLVQYYFGNKKELIRATFRAVIDDAARQFMRRVEELGANAGPRDMLRTILLGLLPLDKGRRENTIVLAAFHAASLTGSEVSNDQILGPPNLLVTVISDQLRKAGAAADTVERDAELIAVSISGLTQGLVSDMPVDPETFVDHLLDRTLGSGDRSR
ncbi:TetR/AcrR family transcriptional regulator [Nocardia mexicana]|uniref:TetR family transcriptional regulator n=1 Tax=Nocardia mexicana TaxID=279262 RepID=A0A370GS58_9NOCA|nr:TetR family transcriptional regulator [Nocardia mexicana]RDI46341.1 TetR family transcriptional regulator [Nocardia mexicana]